MSISDKTKKSLEKIGLTSYEIRAYTTLIKDGESNASEISQNSGVPYSKDSPSRDTHEKSKNEDIVKINISFKRFSHF